MKKTRPSSATSYLASMPSSLSIKRNSIRQGTDYHKSNTLNNSLTKYEFNIFS